MAFCCFHVLGLDELQKHLRVLIQEPQVQAPMFVLHPQMYCLLYKTSLYKHSIGIARPPRSLKLRQTQHGRQSD